MSVAIINFVRNIYWNDRENLEVEILDYSLKKLNIDSEILYLREDESNDLDIICDKKKAIIFSCDFNINEKLIREIYSFAEKIKKNNKQCKIIIFGERAMLTGQDIMEDCSAIDYVFVGYPEDFAQYVRNIICGNTAREIFGVYYRENNCITKIEVDEKVAEPIPWASRDIHVLQGTKTARIRTTRGCKGRCTFCIDVGYNKNWKGRDSKDIVNEIEYIRNHYGIRQFSFYDNSIEDSSEPGMTRLRSIMDEIEKRNMKIYFSCSARAESFKKQPSDLELIEQMSRLGLFNIVFGLESGYQHDLDIFNKKANISDNYRAVELFKRYKVNILTVPGFIMFHPYSTVESLKNNAHFLKSFGKSYSFLTYCSTMRVFKGTKIYYSLKTDGLLKQTYNYMSTQNYLYANESVGTLGKKLENIRLDSKSVALGVAIENAYNLLAKVEKGYTCWNGVSALKNDLQTVSDSFSFNVNKFFDRCIELVDGKWNDEVFQVAYTELEELSEKLSIYGITKNFIKSNLMNKELNYVL